MNRNDLCYSFMEELFRIAAHKDLLKDNPSLTSRLQSMFHGQHSKTATFDLTYNDKPVKLVLDYSVSNKGYLHQYEISHINGAGVTEWKLTVDKKIEDDSPVNWKYKTRLGAEEFGSLYGTGDGDRKDLYDVFDYLNLTNAMVGLIKRIDPGHTIDLKDYQPSLKYIRSAVKNVIEKRISTGETKKLEAGRYSETIKPTSEDLQHVTIRWSKKHVPDRPAAYHITVLHTEKPIWRISIINPEVQMSIFKDEKELAIPESDIEETFSRLKGMHVLHEIEISNKVEQEHVVTEISDALRHAEEIMNTPSI